MNSLLSLDKFVSLVLSIVVVVLGLAILTLAGVILVSIEPSGVVHIDLGANHLIVDVSPSDLEDAAKAAVHGAVGSISLSTVGMAGLRKSFT